MKGCFSAMQDGEMGRLFLFLPTLYFTELPFHLHGEFQSNVGRTNIHGNFECNKRIRDGLLG